MSVGYEYVAWFQDPSLEKDDEDFEWPAVFVVVAESENDARMWGDTLAKSFSDRTEHVFMRSSVGAVDASASPLPVVNFGEAALDDEIGW